MEGLRKAGRHHEIAEVDLALNGLQRALAIEVGHDLSKVKLESFDFAEVMTNFNEL